MSLAQSTKSLEVNFSRLPTDEPEVNDTAPGVKDKVRDVKDGGWGWVVVLSAFTINVITDGCLYSFGVLFVYLVEYFDSSRSQTAWIGSVLYSTPLLCGPLASALNSRIGYRKATIIGACIATAGFCLSYFANSLLTLCLTYGVIAGLGISVPYLNAVVAVVDRFENKLSLANGIAQSGAGIGTLIFAPLFEVLIMEYGWRGAVLIIGGIVGNVIVCGALMRPLKPNKTNQENEDDVSQTSNCLLDSSVAGNKKDGSLFSSCPSNIGGIEKESSTYGRICALHNDIQSCPELAIKQKKSTLSKKSVIPSRFSFISNRAFIVFCFTNILLLFWYDVPYIFTVDRSALHGISEKNSALLVSLMGILHTFGNVLYGYIGDKHWVNRNYLYCASLILWGITLVLIPFFTAYIPSAILVGAFGFLSASSEVYGSVILVDILGAETLNDAYGILMFLQGIANLLGPPFAGE